MRYWVKTQLCLLSMLAIPLLGSASIHPQDSTPINPESFEAELKRLEEILLGDTGPMRKASAATKILAMDTPESLRALKKILRLPKDANPTTLKAILVAFSGAGNYSALEEMLLLVLDQREDIRSAALQELRNLQDTRSRLVEEINRIIHSPASQLTTRRAAIVTAGELELWGTTEGISFYLPTTDKENGEATAELRALADAAHRSLEKICFRWFGNRQEFEVWWEQNHLKTREQILAQELERRNADIIQNQTALLKGDFERHLQALAHELPEVRRLAAIGIHDFRTTAVSRAIDPLVQQFARESHPAVREAILLTLGSIGAGNDKVRDLLLETLDSMNPPERRVAVTALTNFARDRSVLPKLKAIMQGWMQGQRKDEDEFRIALLSTLEKAGTPEILDTELGELLAHLLRLDHVADVRKQAALALGVHGNEKAVAVLGAMLDAGHEADSNVRYNAANALRQISTRLEQTTQALDYYYEYLQDPVRDNRIQAIGLLGQVPSNKSTGPLLDRLHEEIDPLTRKNIFNSLGKIADKKALEPLFSMELRESDDRQEYFRTLELICGNELVPLLQTAAVFSGRGEPHRAAKLYEKILRLPDLDEVHTIVVKKNLIPAYLAAADQEVVTSGEQKAAQDLYSLALTQLHDLREAEPENLEWLLQTAEVHVRLEQSDEAIQSYATVMNKLEALGDTVPGYLQRALDPYTDLLLKRNEYEKAIPLLRKLVSIAPTNRKYLARLAASELTANQFKAAIEDYRKLHALIPREEKQEYWQIAAVLADLLLVHNNGELVADMLQALPKPEDVSAELYQQLQELKQRLLKLSQVIGPPPPPKLELPDKKE